MKLKRRAISYIPATMATVIVLVLFTASVLYMNSKYAEYIAAARENNAAVAQAAKENLLLGFSGQDVMVLNQGGQSVALKTLLTIDKNGIAQPFDLRGAVVAQGSSLIEKSSSISTTNNNSLSFVQAGGSIGVVTVLGSAFWIGTMASTTGTGVIPPAANPSITVFVAPQTSGFVSCSLPPCPITTSGSISVSAGSSLSLTASPSSFNRFVEWIVWSSSSSSTSGSQTISVLAGSYAIAVFQVVQTSPPPVTTGTLTIGLTDLQGWPLKSDQPVTVVATGSTSGTFTQTTASPSFSSITFTNLPFDSYTVSVPTALLYTINNAPMYQWHPGNLYTLRSSLSILSTALLVSFGNRLGNQGAGTVSGSTTVPFFESMTVDAFYQLQPQNVIGIFNFGCTSSLFCGSVTDAQAWVAYQFSSNPASGYPVLGIFDSSKVYNTTIPAFSSQYSVLTSCRNADSSQCQETTLKDISTGVFTNTAAQIQVNTVQSQLLGSTDQVTCKINKDLMACNTLIQTSINNFNCDSSELSGTTVCTGTLVDQNGKGISGQPISIIPLGSSSAISTPTTDSSGNFNTTFKTPSQLTCYYYANYAGNPQYAPVSQISNEQKICK